jgi:hypothetical protein
VLHRKKILDCGGNMALRLWSQSETVVAGATMKIMVNCCSINLTEIDSNAKNEHGLQGITIIWMRHRQLVDRLTNACRET